jgi:hypothetical protein
MSSWQKKSIQSQFSVAVKSTSIRTSEYQKIKFQLYENPIV